MYEMFGLTFVGDFIAYLESIIDQYIDIDFTLWVSWLLTPLIITFVLPLLIVCLLYITSILLYIYKWHRQRIKDAYEQDFWHGARKLIAAIWDAHGWLWHGFEVDGMENIPDDTPALIVYYHGAIPIDMYYVVAKVMLLKNRLIHTVADRFLFKVPGWRIISEAMNVIPGTIQTCSTILKENNLLAISPGGVFEAQFSNAYYKLLWKKRLGFAKVALEAKVAIIPMFTENIREAFRSVGVGRRFWLRLYAATQMPIVPIYGGFPVKLVTHVGKPIPYSPDATPEQLQSQVADAIEALIKEHQRIPGSITMSLVQRLPEIVTRHLTSFNVAWCVACTVLCCAVLWYKGVILLQEL